jgi:hypothetical protein
MKAPGTQRLKLSHDESLSIFVFNSNLRRFNLALEIVAPMPVFHALGNGRAWVRGLHSLRLDLNLSNSWIHS